jgi:MFS family permease
MAIFFSAATAAGAFGGLLARGINEMTGLGGLKGWQWIFVLEGLLTLVVAIAALFVMNDYPSTAKFLTAEEKTEISRRLEQDRSGLADEFNIKYAWDAFKDWKIYAHMISKCSDHSQRASDTNMSPVTIGIYTPLYSFSLFLPTIVKTLGYADNKAQLMTVPPYVVACVCCISAGYFADKLQTRGVFMIGFTIVAILGFVMQIASSNPHVKVFIPRWIVWKNPLICS